MKTELHLTKKDFQIDWFSGSGAGGQYRNKHQNCCRITHIATGLTSTSQRHRDRPSNQRDAFNRLVAKIVALLEDDTPGRRESTKEIRVYKEHLNTAISGKIAKPLKRFWRETLMTSSNKHSKKGYNLNQDLSCKIVLRLEKSLST